MSGEGSNERVSRARALRLVAFGAAGAAGMMLAEAPAADAAVDSSYIAQNNGSSDLGRGTSPSRDRADTATRPADSSRAPAWVCTDPQLRRTV